MSKELEQEIKKLKRIVNHYRNDSVWSRFHDIEYLLKYAPVDEAIESIVNRTDRDKGYPLGMRVDMLIKGDDPNYDPSELSPVRRREDKIVESKFFKKHSKELEELVQIFFAKEEVIKYCGGHVTIKGNATFLDKRVQSFRH